MCVKEVAVHVGGSKKDQRGLGSAGAGEVRQG